MYVLCSIYGILEIVLNFGIKDTLFQLFFVWEGMDCATLGNGKQFVVSTKQLFNAYLFSLNFILIWSYVVIFVVLLLRLNNISLLRVTSIALAPEPEWITW